MNSEYILPFDTNKNPVIIRQGYHGSWSHKKFEDLDLTLAVDFALPLESPVMAARSGKVIKVIDHNYRFYSGLLLETGVRLSAYTNWLAISHDDGTTAYYLHLERNDAKVKDGQGIQQGDIIGVTDQSGWVGPNPHLHFQVNNDETMESLPITFRDYPEFLEYRGT